MENINVFPDISYFQDNKLNYHPYFHSALYKRKMTAKMHAAIYCELIARACTPARLFQWNEGAAEQFPAEYLQECEKYKKWSFFVVFFIVKKMKYKLFLFKP